MKKIIITENQYKRLIEISSPHKTYGDDYLTPKEEYLIIIIKNIHYGTQQHPTQILPLTPRLRTIHLAHLLR